jgi:LmbE family N-acetylglucosaminyl deacetylase/tetratricopeptide (TPR) repeat protein
MLMFAIYNHVGLILAFAQIPLMLQFQKSEDLLRKGNVAGAEQQILKVLERAPDLVVARKALGTIRVRQNRLDDAIRIYEEIVASHPDDAAARIELGELYSWRRDYDRAIVTFKDIIATDTLDIGALKGLARVLRWATRYQESEATYGRVLVREPDDVDALAGLAQTVAQQKRLDEALALINRAVRKAPANIDLLKTKADILGWSNRYREAEQEYRSLLPRTDRKAELYHAIGDVNAWQGKPVSALDAFHKAAELDPLNASHLVSIGKVGLENGLDREVEWAIESLFVIDPGSTQAFELLRTLEGRKEPDYARIVDGYLEPVALVTILVSIAVFFRRRMDVLKRRHFYYWVVTYPIIPGIVATYVLFFIASRFGGFAYFGVVKGIAEVVVFFFLMLAFSSLLWVSRTHTVTKPRTVLAVGAHPDDLELGCGGALAKFKDSGYRVCGIVITGGEKGNAFLAEGKNRGDEARAGAGTLGLDALWVCDFNDTRLFSQINEMKSVIEEKIVETGAEIVITQSRDDMHQDHRAVFEATKIAARGAHTLLCYEDVSTEPHFVPNYFVDISEYIEDKIDAVATHKTQKHRLYTQPEAIRGRAAHRGMQSGVKYAEAFLLYKGVDVCPL